jgi:methylamine dehydrogenase accessory protein MauD
MNTLLVVAVVLLFAVVIALALVVLGLTRQVGVLLERVSPAGALMTGKGLQPGDAAPQLVLETLDGPPIDFGGERETGRSWLVFFLSPTCPMCDALLPVVRAISESERDWLDVLLASDGDDEDHAGFVARKGIQDLPYVVSRDLGVGFRVAQLPFGALVDEKGVVAAAGLTNTREHLESLLEAKKRGVGSIQQYLEG